MRLLTASKVPQIDLGYSCTFDKRRSIPFFDIISLTKKLILILGLRQWTSNEQQRVVQRTVLGGVLIARVGGRVTLKVAGPKSQEDKCTSHRYDTVRLEEK